MANVFESDFAYSKRFGLKEPLGYLFKVRGESANYLMNKYWLCYANVFVNCYSHDCVYVCSRTDDKMKSDCADCYEDDAHEIYEAVKSAIMADSKNYDEYLANSDYYTKDSRWE